MNDLIIGCSSGLNWDHLKYWVNSINRSGFQGKKVLILLNCDKFTANFITSAGFEIFVFSQNQNGDYIYPINNNVPVHVERFLHIFDFINRNEPFRYVITTDVRDVIFQKNPTEWLEKNLGNKLCVFSSESMLYKDEPWGNRNLIDTYGPYIHNIWKENEIFNVGVLAGKSDAIKALAINIYMSALNRPIPICDQSTFNFMVSQEPYRSSNLYVRSEDGWACQLGTSLANIDFRPYLLENSPRMKDDGKMYTSTGAEYFIVHQWDRVPPLKEQIEKRYSF